jgi:hypothetical protein
VTLPESGLARRDGRLGRRAGLRGALRRGVGRRGGARGAQARGGHAARARHARGLDRAAARTGRRHARGPPRRHLAGRDDRAGLRALTDAGLPSALHAAMDATKASS